MAEQDRDFDALLEETSLGSRGARQLRARTPAYRALAARTIARWHRYSDPLLDRFQIYLALEDAASHIRAYEMQFVHGLLQTEPYARAVMRLGRPEASDAEVEKRVALRLARQKHFFTESRLRNAHIVLDETALRRPLGSPAVMRNQIQYLIDISEQENVLLQVMPFSIGGHPSGTGAFTIFSFPDSDPPDVVYLEQLVSALYLDSWQDVAQYDEVMRQMQESSLTPAETRLLLRELL